MIYGATTGVLLDGGARNRLTNDGSIIGGNSGLYIDAAHARVANHGVIQGDYAVDIHDTDVSFQNDGTIVGTVSTIGADGLRMSLESDGILMSSGRALRVQSIAGETAHIVNEGKISGVDMAFDGGAGNEVLINRGTISGSVTLGTGNDVFDNRHGTLLSTNAYGQGGRDVSGESGNDTYIIDSRIRIIELAGGGEDTVKSTISINFGAGNLTYEELENLTLIGGRDSNGTGSALDNTIKGNGGDNILSGAGGTDLLTGNAGADTFVFKTGFGHDTINDFGRGADRIDLRDFVDVSGFNDFMKHHVTVSGADLIIGSGSDTLTLLHTAKSDLDASDFMF